MTKLSCTDISGHSAGFALVLASRPADRPGNPRAGRPSVAPCYGLAQGDYSLSVVVTVRSQLQRHPHPELRLFLHFSATHQRKLRIWGRVAIDCDTER